MIYKVLLTLLVITLTHTNCQARNTKGSQIQQDSIRSGEEYLDLEQNYLLKWNVSLTEKRIYFEVTAKTTGYIGFGISPNGGMAGADIFIAGAYQNGSQYSSDRHAEGEFTPIIDTTSDWVLTSASETAPHTTIRFNRLLNTCDEEDYPITDATVRVIYAMGDTDTLEHHGANKGTKSINFFLEDDNFDPEKNDSFDIIATSVMPAQETSYWCTFHNVSAFSEKKHVIAFEPVLEGELALAHTHHFTLFKCIAPENVNPDELFGPVVGQGLHCFDSENQENFPKGYCTTPVYGWSKGGKRTVFPSNVGLPVPDKLNENEYYYIETHFDNPQNLSGKEIKSGVRAYYINNLREHDAGMLIVNHDTSPALTVPVESENFIISGHCSSACTEKEVPEEGLTLFNNLFHSHLAGRKMKLRHFRGNKELPWIGVDDHYDFNYQQSIPLSTYVKLEKGDQLTVECTYDNFNKSENRIITGGLSTREEMCEAILWYYPKREFILCGSAQDIPSHFAQFGITNFTTKDPAYPGGFPVYDILAPETLTGEYVESISFKFNWTQEFREAYQREKSTGEQVNYCLGVESINEGTVKYPENLEEFVPENECSRSENSGYTVSISIAVLLLAILQTFHVIVST
ncbi:unnamed protein product [Orchesella dallaii]|uniref:DOMON domain-containing protein n=1 Tax=Orchesella dallaii TaxID=48710 RepID=A0ABP1QPZ1_9HEXA